MKVVWKDVVGFEGFYSVSSTGLIKRTKPYRNSKDKPLKTVIACGYPRVTLCKNNKKHMALVHRVVADAFIGIPKSMVVNHIDGDKTNNNLNNLEVVTRSENELHKHHVLKNGNCHFSKLTESDVKKIRELRKTGLTIYKLGEMFGVRPTNISEIINFKTWKYC